MEKITGGKRACLQEATKRSIYPDISAYNQSLRRLVSETDISAHSQYLQPVNEGHPVDVGTTLKCNGIFCLKKVLQEKGVLNQFQLKFDCSQE